jgi:integrase
MAADNLPDFSPSETATDDVATVGISPAFAPQPAITSYSPYTATTAVMRELTGHGEKNELTILPFEDAAQVWLESRFPYLSPKTVHEYKGHIRILAKFFGRTDLKQIHAEDIRSYQRMRMAVCGPHAINHECSVLQQILKRAQVWDRIAWDYQALPMPKEARGRALSPDEFQCLFRTGLSNPAWRPVCITAMIAINTTAGPKEILTLRRKDIELENRVIRVQPEGAKNSHRVRVIPLNDMANEAILMALELAGQKGSYLPDHYVFPFRVGKGAAYDPTRHQTTLTTAWLKMVKAAGIKQFRFYAMRHHAITNLLQDPGVSEETVEAICGHVSRKMKKAYSHIRIEVKRSAVLGLLQTEFADSSTFRDLQQRCGGDAKGPARGSCGREDRNLDMPIRHIATNAEAHEG